MMEIQHQHERLHQFLWTFVGVLLSEIALATSRFRDLNGKPVRLQSKFNPSGPVNYWASNYLRGAVMCCVLKLDVFCRVWQPKGTPPFSPPQEIAGLIKGLLTISFP